jgi:TolB protein
MALAPTVLFAAERDDTPPELLIGYTEFRTDLPGGRHANVKTRRAVVIKADGTGLRRLASRNGYRGVIDFLDVYDFHDGSSDLPVWAPDSKSVFYTAKVGNNVELFRVPLDGKSEPLTGTLAGSMHYHPAASPDGKWLVYGSKRDGIRQLYVMRLSDKKEWRITDLKKGRAAMWPHWQLRATP